MEAISRKMPLRAHLILVIIIVTRIFVSSITLNQNHTAAVAQQQQSLVSKDISFVIDNVTFSHHNGICIINDHKGEW